MTFKMFWDTLVPMAICAGILLTVHFMNRPQKAKRIWHVLAKFPRELQQAWSPPKTRSVIPTTKQIEPADHLFHDHDGLSFITQMKTMYNHLNEHEDFGYHLLFGTFPSSGGSSQHYVPIVSVNLISSGALAVVGSEYCGKTHLIHTALAALTTQRSYTEIQFIFINPQYRSSPSPALIPSPFLFLNVTTSTMLTSAITMIKAELDRRTSLFMQHGIGSWSDYPHKDLPLLIIYIAGFFMIQQSLGKEDLDAFLQDVMNRGIPLGIRPILEVYSFAYLDTPWQPSITTHICGPIAPIIEQFYFDKYFPNLDFDEANAILPSQLQSNDERRFTLIPRQGFPYTFIGF